MTSFRPVLRSNPSHFCRAGLLAAALALGAAAPARAVPTFSLAPSQTSVRSSQAFTVDVLANDVTDLFGYQFNVSYDPGLYRVTGVDGGTFLSGSGGSYFSPGTIDNAAGSVSFVFETIVGGTVGASGSGRLGTIGFSALGRAGSGRIGLNEVSAIDSALDTIDLAPVGTAVVSVVVSAVPEPTTWGMLSLGLMALAGVRRSRSMR